ncbi:MAG TPA: hypothetical protein VGK67_02600 [Myxococcales bacterium]
MLDALVSLFHARRDDSAFFERLTPFLAALRESAAAGESGLPARDAEVLSQATVESLVEELRARLRTAPRGATAAILRSLIGERTAALLSLALLAAGASGCTPSSTPAPSNEPGTAATPIAPLPVVPLKQLAPPPPPQKAVSRDQLVEMFKQKSAEEAAKALEKAFDASTPGPAPADMPKYKGVNF